MNTNISSDRKQQWQQNPACTYLYVCFLKEEANSKYYILYMYMCNVYYNLEIYRFFPFHPFVTQTKHTCGLGLIYFINFMDVFDS
jgi:hypothetical protein